MNLFTISSTIILLGFITIAPKANAQEIANGNTNNTNNTKSQVAYLQTESSSINNSSYNSSNSMSEIAYLETEAATSDNSYENNTDEKTLIEKGANIFHATTIFRLPQT